MVCEDEPCLQNEVEVSISQPEGGKQIEHDETALWHQRMSKITDKVFAVLENNATTWGELVEYVSDPTAGEGTRKYNGLFRNKERVERILNHWISPRNGGGRDTVRDWAVKYVSTLVDKEGKTVTKDGFLRARNKAVDESFIQNFNLEQIYTQLKALCPTMAKVIEAFSTTHRQCKEEKPTEKKRRTVRF